MRVYIPEIGRWNGADPMSHGRDWLSPYQYVQNNPILRIDPDGMLDDYYDIEGNYLGSDGEGNNIRLITEGKEQSVQSKLNGANTSSENRASVRSSENSKIIEIDESANSLAQDVADHSLSEGREHQGLYI